jgi:hypothetical protein
MRSYGWLFDVYAARTMMVVWLYRDDGTLGTGAGISAARA